MHKEKGIMASYFCT